MAEKKKFGKWCAFKDIMCQNERTSCALKDPNTNTCVFIAINNNLYHIRKAIEELDEKLEK